MSRQLITLFVNVYRDADPVRDAELREVDRRNAALADRLLVRHCIDGRPTFADIFRVIAERATAADVSIIANSDIYFDETIHHALGIESMNAYALTRWEDRPGDAGPFVFADDNGKPRSDSQDAWVFRGPPPQSLIDACDFFPGVRGCDNRVTAELLRAGYAVSNPSKTIRAIHLHNTGVRRYGTETVPGPYLLIEPHRLGEPPRHHWISITTGYVTAADWAQRTRDASADLAVIPADERFLWIDEAQVPGVAVDHPAAVPFPQEYGQYSGPPADGAAAVVELDRLRQQGIHFAVLAWPAFWWLDHYRELAEHLRSTYQIVLQNDRVIVFDGR